jgi:hypothetical protein
MNDTSIMYNNEARKIVFLIEKSANQCKFIIKRYENRPKNTVIGIRCIDERILSDVLIPISNLGMPIISHLLIFFTDDVIFNSNFF